MITVGLTGGIGAGKSEVARLLATFGALVVDADALAREALATGTSELSKVVEEFGSEVLRPDGSLDRGRLGCLVFADPELLTVLNGIVHPYVARRSAELMAQAPADAVVVYDVPLLVENALQGEYDVVVVVDTSPATQVARLVADRGMTAEGALARMSAQATREARRAVADAIIDNDGTLSSLDRQVRDLWDRLVGDQQAVGDESLD